MKWLLVVGTVAGLVVLAIVVYRFASQGPVSFRVRYADEVESRLADPPEVSILTDEHLEDLPEPVRRYVVATGALGRPRPWYVRAAWRGGIRSAAGSPWMEFTAEQHNFLGEPSRFFLIDARRSGLPVDVYHDFSDGRARMRVRLLSLVPLVDARGPEMDRAETVTLFNDVALLAPGALADPRIEWEPIDDRAARGLFTAGDHTVAAILRFNAADELVDFVSADRFAVVDGRFERRRWSTPISGHAVFGGLRLLSRGEGRWHPEGSEDFAYIELELLRHGLNGAEPLPPGDDDERGGAAPRALRTLGGLPDRRRGGVRRASLRGVGSSGCHSRRLLRLNT